MKKYVVQPGDTLYQISQRTGVRIPLLLASNPQIHDPNQLVPGMNMVIPELGKPAKTSATGPVKKKKTTKPVPPYFGFVWPHQVQSGETWHSIAKKYGVTKEQLTHVNHSAAKAGKLAPGSVIYVPTSAMPSQSQHGEMQPHYAKPKPQYAKPKQGMPQQGQTQPGTQAGEAGMNMPGTTQEEPPYGPHSHQPYRPEEFEDDYRASMKVPEGWFVDVDESSSAMSSWDAWDDATRPEMRGEIAPQKQKQKASKRPVEKSSDEGWSGSLTVRLDEES